MKVETYMVIGGLDTSRPKKFNARAGHSATVASHTTLRKANPGFDIRHWPDLQSIRFVPPQKIDQKVSKLSSGGCRTKDSK